ncbi:Asp-tRNA(Asn)/Glu-tRNA(Gln) amidotransferase subunit GatC [Sedimentisphaera salicampi]|uniref:Aspartyl/glutamyl-tRNA(Asn/Gln) amidotransferase subunit C n=1 Tax=Sedimentisphaera salicampi TaxID=1941349 RepID=A0A1W6LN98_9BACT|nr:Asp-tRNA(Asn)/Glu-tRNA(Gln) amidotransferase subunit GatC [Sedimentisphaera salicampi]ARN57234.1 Glutamyl-tRNA(Gln) amidotransferase subunit C [Sedimentisphaera salicampi]OXU14675.1 Glutamyl-tRNA(Gln) amidotransferase subunit C [Sedimentisphaera salicampi]
MPEMIDEKQVREVAELARLELTEDEVQQFAAQLSDILEYIEKLGELDTESVEPLAHSLLVKNVFREDAPGETLNREAALKNAPHSDGEHFCVPKVLE